MRILLSAFAFAPGKGSEPGVGWSFAGTLARAGHQVTVLTKPEAYAESIETLAADPSLRSIEIISVGRKMPKAMFIARALFQLNYILWQIFALRVATRLHKKHPFDVVHAVTTSGIRFPCFLGFLGIPFMIGPLGGGEITPACLLRDLSGMHRLSEELRSLSTRLLSLDPLMRATFAKASLILVRTEDTGRAIPRRFAPKIKQSHGIGIEAGSIVTSPRAHRSANARFGVLFVARLIYWKGGDLVLKAFARASADIPDAHLTIVGRGPEAGILRALCDRLGLTARVTWRDDWLESADLERIYEENQVLLFPSYHEAGGTVVLEAFAKAMPVVCLDVGGPAQMVGDDRGIAVRTGDATRDAVIERLADALVALSTDGAHYEHLSRNALETARQMSWEGQVGQAYTYLQDTRQDVASSVGFGKAISKEPLAKVRRA